MREERAGFRERAPPSIFELACLQRHLPPFHYADEVRDGLFDAHVAVHERILLRERARRVDVDRRDTGLLGKLAACGRERLLALLGMSLRESPVDIACAPVLMDDERLPLPFLVPPEWNDAV